MKALLINGSPHPEGCTYTALRAVAEGLAQQGVDSEIFWIGRDAIRGCTACGGCATLDNACAFGEDCVNAALEKARLADGLVFGAPVHYASPAGAMVSFLDRFFYAGECVAGKPAACVVSARRGGTTAALDVLNKYPIIAGMPLVPSQYWPMVHGNTPQQVAQDLEGLQIMRTLGRNMGWLLRCIEAGRAAGITPPQPEQPRAVTNFIR